MAIENDFTVYPDSKVIRHTGSNDTVYEVSAFYSWLQNLFDEPGYMSYQKPIKYNTPTSYTMLNGWFLDNGDADSTLGDTGNILEYLTGGSIDTSGYATVDDPIYMMDVDTEVAAFTNGDKDKVVRCNATDNHGPLLAFKANYPSATTARCWFRDVNSIGTPGAGEAVEVTTGGGTGSYTNTGGGAASSGDEIYANIYTIASWAGTPNAQVYIKQEHPIAAQGDIRVAEWSNANNWDRGSTTTEEIDILLPVKLGGASIDPTDPGRLIIYGRQTGDTFTHYSTTVSVSGASRTPIAMETSADEVNITKGEHYLLYDASTGAGAFSEDDVIQSVSTASTTPPTWYAEVVSVTEFTVNTTGVLILRGLRGTIADNDSIWVGTTDTADANGTPGGTYTTASAVGVELTAGFTCTGGSSTAKRVCKGIDTAQHAYVFAVDEAITGSSKDVYYKDFTTGETITDTGTGSITHYAGSSTSIVSDYTDVTIAHINGTVAATSIGSLEVGELVTWSGGGPAVYVGDNGSNTVWLANVEDETNLNVDTTVVTGASSAATFTISGTGGMTDDDEQQFNFSLQSHTALYSVVIEAGTVYNAGRTLEDVYAFLQYKCRDGETDVFYTSDGSTITEVQGQFYITANSSYAVSKVAPFGTLAGGVFFGAQTVWIQGTDSSDNNSIKLTDQGGTLRYPHTSVDVTVSNTRVGDRVAVFLEDGTTELPKKDQYTIAVAGVVQSASAINKTTGTDFPNDTPSSGWVYVVDDSANEEHKYRYKSWTGEALTLADERTGVTATAGTTGQTYIAAAATFQTWNIEVGDIIRRTTGATTDVWAYVTSIDSEIQIKTTVLSDGTDWASTNVIEMNSTIVAYTSSDTFFIPYLEAIEDTGTSGSPGSETNTLTYVSSREVVIRVRNVGGVTPIQPFVTTNQIGTTGMSQSVIRTEDEVYT